MATIEDIRQEIRKLIALYESERARADRLAGELEERNKEARRFQEQIIELQDQIDVLRLKGALGDDGVDPSSSKKEMIDSLVREIDKCISLLGG